MRSAGRHDDEDETMIDFDDIDGQMMCLVKSDCADSSEEAVGFSRDCMVHSSMAWDICSRLKDSMTDSSGDTTDIGDWDLCKFDQLDNVAGGLQSECSFIFQSSSSSCLGAKP